jgi:FkbM family methyltransferase
MIGKLFRSSLQRFGYDLTHHPLPDWEVRPASLRNGVMEILTRLNINCVVDVGANEGQYGESLRDFGYQGRIASFEPVSTTYDRLAERSKTDPNWRAYRSALGAANQSLDISVMGGDQFSSLLPMNSYGHNQFDEQAVVIRTEQVEVARLDSKILEITEGLDEPRIYLKMDTQGYDLQVLEGASGCLAQILGLQSEIALQPIYEGMPDYLTSLAKFNSSGFTITSLVPVSRDRHMRVIEFDCMMVRKEQDLGFADRGDRSGPGR